MNKSFFKIFIVIIFISSCATPSMLRYPPEKWLRDDDERPIAKPYVKHKKGVSDEGVGADLTKGVADVMDFADQLASLPAESAYAGREEALNVSNFDEAPDSSWFTNRIGRGGMTPAQVAGGAGGGAVLRGPWKVFMVSASPGLPVAVASNEEERFVLRFDSREGGEGDSGGDVIASLILAAAGYNATERRIAFLSEGDFTAETDEMTADLKKMFSLLPPPSKDGHRAVVTTLPRGKVLGPMTFNKKRRGDPNDRIPHEHRRELRGLRVFASWLNDFDMGPAQTADVFIPADGGKGFVRHYVVFPAMSLNGVFGSARAQDDKESGAHVMDSLFSFGFYNPYWTGPGVKERVQPDDFTDIKGFDPKKWRARHHNTAFKFMTKRDAFWASRIISKFSDSILAAVVAKAEFSDPEKTANVLQGLKDRRDKLVSYWFSRVGSLDNFRIDDAGGRILLLFDDPLNGTHYQFLVQDFFGKVCLQGWTDFKGREVVLPESVFSEMRPENVHTVILRSWPEGRKWPSPAVEVYVRKSGGKLDIVGLKRL